MKQNKQEQLEVIKKIVHKIYMEEDLIGGAKAIQNLLSQSRQEAVEDERKRVDKIIIKHATMYIGDPTRTQTDERKYMGMAIARLREHLAKSLSSNNLKDK